MMNEKIIVQQPVASLLFGIRSIGYTFPSAVADIFDNSISANASKIMVYSDPREEEPYFQIIDNGHGMSRNELENAILLGSNRDDKEENSTELGRFGLGLKTASLSQCRSLTVVSKKYGRIRAIVFDVDHIEKVNEWEMILLSEDEINNIPNIQILKALPTGTMVMWKKFDRLEVSADNFVNSFQKIVESTTKHCEFVFHRFYDHIEILFNEKRVERRDPFLKDFFPNTQFGQVYPLVLTSFEDEGSVTPYTIPYANQLSPEQKRLLGNPKSIYDDQGFYIYRNKRLILWGTWFRMDIKSELHKHSRVQIDIPSSWDSIWDLDVKKSSARIPDILKQRIRAALSETIEKSKKISRGKARAEVAEDNPVWLQVRYRDGTKFQINRESPVYKKLLELSPPESKKLLEHFINQVENYIPKNRIIYDSAESRQIYNGNNEEDLEKLEESFFELLKIIGQTESNALNLLRGEEFSALSGYKERILRKVKENV